MQLRESRLYGTRGLCDALDTVHKGLVVDVLEAQPEAARGDVGSGDRFGGRGEQGLQRRRCGPTTCDAGYEASAVQSDGEIED